MGNSASSKLPPLQVAASCDTAKFMGTWFVIGVKPTVFEKTCSNAVEKYSWISQDQSSKSHAKHDIDIAFQYNKDETTESKVSSLPQKGWIVESDDTTKANCATWKVSPMWPIKMPYLILEVKEDDYTVIGYPSRDYCWIMSRTPTMTDAKYAELTTLLKDKHHYDLEGLRKVPQNWNKAEREKRGLTEVELPDKYLN